MVALPGRTTTSLTNDRMKALVSVNSLVFRNSLISSAKAAMVSALSSINRRSTSMALASWAAASNCPCRSRCSLMRSAASAVSTSVVSTNCQMRPSRRFTSSNSASMVSSFWRCSRAIPSISSSTSFTRSRMLDSVSTFSRIWPMINPSKLLALSLGVSQAPLPFLSREWQT